MNALLSSIVAQRFGPDPDLVDACGDDPGGLCEWVYEQTDRKSLAALADWLIDRPVRVVLVIVAAIVIKALIQRSIRHFGQRLVDNDTRGRLSELSRRPGVDQMSIDARAKARTGTISAVLSSAAGVMVWSVATLLILGELGIDLAPLLAGAGIAGIAVGFGAQTVVRDFLSGFFMLVEDQFGVGDVIDVGPVTGTVERVSLRATVLRDVNGNVWHVPNGEITRVGNRSQLWSRAVLDIEVAYDTDLRLAQGIIQRVADEVWRDPSFTDGDIIEPPEVWGIETLGADGIAIRLVVKTDPAEQWVVARELRLRIKDAFDAAGVEMPYAQRTVWLNTDPRPEKPDPATIPVSRPRRASASGEPETQDDAPDR